MTTWRTVIGVEGEAWAEPISDDELEELRASMPPPAPPAPTVDELMLRIDELERRLGRQQPSTEGSTA